MVGDRVVGHVLLLVGRLGGGRRRRRARDVGDRRDVVPVDAVADAQGEARDEHADAGRGGGDLGDDVEQWRSSWVSGGRVTVAQAPR